MQQLLHAEQKWRTFFFVVVVANNYIHDLDEHRPQCSNENDNIKIMFIHSQK